MKRTLVAAIMLAVVCLVMQTVTLADEEEQSFDNGCYVKDWVSHPPSTGTYESNPTYCQDYDRSLDGGDGPDRGLVVGAEPKTEEE